MAAAARVTVSQTSKGIHLAALLAAGLLASAQFGMAQFGAAEVNAADVEPLDPLAEAVVHSLRQPPRTEPGPLLDAAIRAASVDAAADATAFFRQLLAKLDEAGADRNELLADLGDAANPGGMLRLESLLATHDPDAVGGLRAIQAAARARRRDPKRLAAAIEGLRSGSHATRVEATDRLGRAGADALPALVDLLQTAGPDDGIPRRIGEGLVRETGPEGRRRLIAWLGSNDIANWPGVISALDAAGGDEVADFLLAPALVPGTPPAISRQALEGLRAAAIRSGEDPAIWQPPSIATAIVRLTRRLDAVLVPLPKESAQVRERDISARAERARAAAHLARDLAALGADDPEAVRLVMLARLESLLVAADDAVEPAKILASLEGPSGIDIEAIGDVLDLAVVRGMFPAAIAACEAIEAAEVPWDADDDRQSPTLPPGVRRALVRTLAVPQAGLQFQAARTLALTGGSPPYPGSSRVVELLSHAATARGVDRVVVAHHDLEIRNQLAMNISRFGYQTVAVATGREAILATRGDRDVVLVLIDARIIMPSAYETTQFIQQQPFGEIPPIMVVVDPLDDWPKSCFLSSLLMRLRDLGCVSVVDRMESFFMPTIDPASGSQTAPPRFPAAFADLVGSSDEGGSARQARAAERLLQAEQARVLLGILSRRGWDLPNQAAAASLCPDTSATRAQYNPSVDPEPIPTPADAPGADVDAPHPQPTT